MATCPYGISSTSDLFHFLQRNETGINPTSLIEQCPIVCTIAAGDGNPDLSGIGVSEIFLIQEYVILPSKTDICHLLFYQLYSSYIIQLGLMGLSMLLELALVFFAIRKQPCPFVSGIMYLQRVLADGTTYIA